MNSQGHLGTNPVLPVTVLKRGFHYRDTEMKPLHKETLVILDSSLHQTEEAQRMLAVLVGTLSPSAQ